MNPFEIEDIVSQDKRGIVFRAHDGERGHTVALRRFFPFGQDGGGLNEEEATALVTAAKSLAGVTHHALRSVIAGSVDPIDSMPYIVAEWIDGAPLDAVLDGGKMEAPQVIDLLQQALEVSITLSVVLGEQGVWVETEADSIFVGSEESGRGFVFWLSPFKWLGAESGSRNLSAIAILGEHLAGWSGKLISDNAGNGLGGWLKWMRNNPDAALSDALDFLKTRATGDAEPPQAAPSPESPGALPFRPVAVVKPPASKPYGIIAVAACLVLAIGGLAAYQKFVKPASDFAQSAEQTASAPTAGNAAPKTAPQPVAANARADGKTERDVSDVNALAAKLAREKEQALAAAKAPKPPAPPAKPKNPPAKPKPTPQVPAESLAAKNPEPVVVPTPIPEAKPPVAEAPPRRDFTPAEGDVMKGLKQDGPASVTGVVVNVRHSKAGNSLYFEFSKPLNAKEISAVGLKRTYQDDFTLTNYRDLIGKKVRFDGVIYREPNGRQYVKISSSKKFKVVP